MVNKQLVLLFSMLVVLTLVLASCGGSTPEEEEVQEPAEQAQEEAAPAEAEEAIAEDPLGNIVVAPGDALRIASSLVIAGPNETLGIDSQTGVEVAIQERGEVLGHPIELQAEDGGCSAEGGQTAATKIAGLFSTFARRRPQMIQAWAAGNDIGPEGEPIADGDAWQPRLWRLVRDQVGIPALAELLPAGLDPIRTGAVTLDLPDRLSVYGLTTTDPLDLHTRTAVGAAG